MLSKPTKSPGHGKIHRSAKSFLEWQADACEKFGNTTAGTKGKEFLSDCKFQFPLEPHASMPHKDLKDDNGKFIYQRETLTTQERTARSTRLRAIEVHDEAVQLHLADPTANPAPAGNRPLPIDDTDRELSDSGHTHLREDRKDWLVILQTAIKNDGLCLTFLYDSCSYDVLLSVKVHPNYKQYAALASDTKCHGRAFLLYNMVKDMVVSGTSSQKHAHAEDFLSSKMHEGETHEAFMIRIGRATEIFGRDFCSTKSDMERALALKPDKGFISLERFACFAYLRALAPRFRPALERLYAESPLGDFEDLDSLMAKMQNWEQQYCRNYEQPDTDHDHSAFLADKRKQGGRRPAPGQAHDTAFDPSKPNPAKPANSHCPHCLIRWEKYFYHHPNSCRTKAADVAAANRAAPPRPPPGHPLAMPSPTHLQALLSAFESAPAGDYKDNMLGLLASNLETHCSAPPGFPALPSAPPADPSA